MTTALIKGEIMIVGQALMHQDVCGFVIAVNDWIFSGFSVAVVY